MIKANFTFLSVSCLHATSNIKPLPSQTSTPQLLLSTQQLTYIFLIYRVLHWLTWWAQTIKQHIIKQNVSLDCAPALGFKRWLPGYKGTPPTSIMQRWFQFSLVEDSYITGHTGGLPFHHVYNLESTAQCANWRKIQLSENLNTFGHLPGH